MCVCNYCVCIYTRVFSTELVYHLVVIITDNQRFTQGKQYLGSVGVLILGIIAVVFILELH